MEKKIKGCVSCKKSFYSDLDRCGKCHLLKSKAFVQSIRGLDEIALKVRERSGSELDMINYILRAKENVE